jgi:hypothetical protein
MLALGVGFAVGQCVCWICLRFVRVDY